MNELPKSPQFFPLSYSPRFFIIFIMQLFIISSYVKTPSKILKSADFGGYIEHHPISQKMLIKRQKRDISSKIYMIRCSQEIIWGHFKIPWIFLFLAKFQNFFFKILGKIAQKLKNWVIFRFWDVAEPAIGLRGWGKDQIRAQYQPKVRSFKLHNNPVLATVDTKKFFVASLVFEVWPKDCLLSV